MAEFKTKKRPPSTVSGTKAINDILGDPSGGIVPQDFKVVKPTIKKSLEDTQSTEENLEGDETDQAAFDELS